MPRTIWIALCLSACGTGVAPDDAAAGATDAPSSLTDTWPGSLDPADTSISSGEDARGADAPRASGPVVYRAFTPLPTAPIASSEWSTGESRGVWDPDTGDLVVLRWSEENTAIHLTTSGDGGATWRAIAADVVNPEHDPCSTGPCYQWPSRLLGVARGGGGALHVLAAGQGGDDGFFYYRLELLRADGHVSGISRSIDPIRLPDHHRSLSADLRGDIGVYDLAGSEVVVWAYTTTLGADLRDLHVFAGRSRGSEPRTAVDFVALDGSVGDTTVTSVVGSAVMVGHYTEALLAQSHATGDLYVVHGQVNADHVVPTDADPDYDLRADRFRSAPSGWEHVGVRTIARADGVAPQLLDVADADEAWVMYLHPRDGVSFGRLGADGALVTAVPSPDATPGRAAFGTFSTDGLRVWAVWHTFGDPADLRPVGAGGHWDGSAWTVLDDPGARDCNGIASVRGWPEGVAAVRFDGELLPQRNVAPSVATITGG